MRFFKPLIVMLTIVSILSCSSDDDGATTDVTANNGELVATVNSTSFTSNDAATSAAIQGGILNITGINNDGDTIVITVNNFESEGTFDLSGSTLQGTAIYLPSGDNKFFNSLNEGGSGDIIITEYDEEKVSGTFSFIAVRQSTEDPNEPTFETVEITNGSFANVSVNVFSN